MPPFAAPYFQRPKHYLAPHFEADNHASFPPGSMPPGAVPKAYNFPANLSAPLSITKYGIVSLGGAVLDSDVKKFCQAAGYPMPNLKLLTVNGATVQSDPGGANTENQLDIQCILQSWNTAYPTTPCDITIALAPNVGNGIAWAVQALDQAGCTDISISWGAPSQTWDAPSRNYTDNVFKNVRAKGKTVCVASGDNSLHDGTNVPSVDYPCASAYVSAIGGTNLKINPDGTIAQEKAWGDGRPGDAGGGGGCDPNTPLPDYQAGITTCSVRGVPDYAANADPQSGYQIYADGKAEVIGGTSGSAPIMCGLFGVLRSIGANLADYQNVLYKNRATAFHDILLGSNGSPATPGWDKATGIGSPNGGGIVAAFQSPVVVPPPVVIPPPVIVSTPVTIKFSNGLATGATGTYAVS